LNFWTFKKIINLVTLSLKTDTKDIEELEKKKGSESKLKVHVALSCQLSGPVSRLTYFESFLWESPKNLISAGNSMFFLCHCKSLDIVRALVKSTLIEFFLI
jgi:hypothetical protein